jgi:hypothetical protein
MKTITCVLILLLVAACSQKDDLDGPIPKCKELLSKEGKPYVELAKQRCDAARTFNEKMNNVGCQVLNEWSGCSQMERLH